MVAQKVFRVTPLKEEDIQNGKVVLTEYRPKLEYRWSAGVAIGRFLDGLQEGRIVGTHCHQCGRTVVPPRAFCEMCFVPVNEYVDLPQTGTVNTFVRSWIATDRSRLKEPLLPAVIDIDGTSKAGILHFVGNVDQKKIKIGMRVKAVWKPAKDRTGDIRDIIHWEPLKEGKK